MPIGFFSTAVLFALVGGAVGASADPPRVVFNPNTQVDHFTVASKYRPLVRVEQDTEHTPPGIAKSMKIETLQSDTLGAYWRIYDKTRSSWGGRPAGDTTDRLGSPIEIEFFIDGSEAINLPDAGRPDLLEREMMEFRFGSIGRQPANPGNNDVLSLRLNRRFFLNYEEEVTPRENRTDQWIVISIQRNAKGNPIGLAVGTHESGEYTEVDESEYELSIKGAPDWSHTSVKRIESWYKSPDNYAFYIGRIALGRLLPQPQNQ